MQFILRPMSVWQVVHWNGSEMWERKRSVIILTISKPIQSHFAHHFPSVEWMYTPLMLSLSLSLHLYSSSTEELSCLPRAETELGTSTGELVLLSRQVSVQVLVSQRSRETLEKRHKSWAEDRHWLHIMSERSTFSQHRSCFNPKSCFDGLLWSSFLSLPLGPGCILQHTLRSPVTQEAEREWTSELENIRAVEGFPFFCQGVFIQKGRSVSHSLVRQTDRQTDGREPGGCKGEKEVINNVKKPANRLFSVWFKLNFPNPPSYIINPNLTPSQK